MKKNTISTGTNILSNMKRHTKWSLTWSLYLKIWQIITIDWIIILKYKRILFLTPLLFGLLGFFIALNINPTFRSQATLVIEESTKNIVNIQEVYGTDVGPGAFRNLNYINKICRIFRFFGFFYFFDFLMKFRMKVMYVACIAL